MKQSLEETISNVSKIGLYLNRHHEYKGVYNLLLSGVEKEYDINRLDIIKMIYDYRHKK